MQQGWFKFPRHLSDHPRARDPDWVAVMVHLLARAHFKPSTATFAGKQVTLQPGQLITSRVEIARTAGVNESKVKRILDHMRIDQQIDQQTSNVSSLITILCWVTSGKSDQPSDQPVTSQRPAKPFKSLKANQARTPKNERMKEGTGSIPKNPPTAVTPVKKTLGLLKAFHEGGSRVQ